MKKNIAIHKLLVIGTLVLLANTSCKESWLDPQPLSFFTPENTFTTEAGFSSALASCASNIREEYYGDGSPIITESIFSFYNALSMKQEDKKQTNISSTYQTQI